MEMILQALMRGLEDPELMAIYLVYMRRLTLRGAAGVVGIKPDRIRVFERRLRGKLFPDLKLKEARDAVATLYEMLPQERQDEVIRHLTGLMPPASETPGTLLAFHRSQNKLVEQGAVL